MAIDDVDFYLEDLKSKFRKLKNVGGYSKYYLSYSGGKDSHLLYWFIKEYSAPEFIDIEIVSINTYMEHPEIRDRIINNSDVVLFPKLKPMKIKEKYGIPCFSKVQDDFIDRWQKGSRTKSLVDRIERQSFIGKDGIERPHKFKLNKKARNLLLSGRLHRVSPKCCYYLKKKTAHDYEKKTGRRAILGVRGQESVMRKEQYKSCFTKTLKFTPLHDLTDELLNKIYSKYNIEIPNVYQYIERTGCMGCPYGSHYDMEYFKESYEVLGIHNQMNIYDFIKEDV